MLIKIYNENPQPREIEKVVALLREGGIVIYPLTRCTVLAVMH